MLHSLYLRHICFSFVELISHKLHIQNARIASYGVLFIPYSPPDLSASCRGSTPLVLSGVPHHPNLSTDSASQKHHYEQPTGSETNNSTQCTSKPTPLPHIWSPRNKHPRHKRQGNSNSAQNTGSLSEPQVSEHWIRYQWKDGAHNVAAKTLCRQSTTAVAMIHIREIVEGCKVDAVDTHC